MGLIILCIQFFYVSSKVLKTDIIFNYIPKVELCLLDLASSFFAFLLFLVLIEKAFSKKWHRLFIHLIISSICGLLYAYYRKTGIYFDSSVLIDNFYLINKKGSSGVIGSFFDYSFMKRVVEYPILLIIFYKFDFRRWVLRLKVFEKYTYTLSLLIAFVFINRNPIYPPFAFIKDLVQGDQVSTSGAIPPLNYDLSLTDLDFKKYNMVILLLESFNGTYLGEVTDEGKEVTPVMNRIMRDNIASKNHFSNSIQTIKGQFSVLCGLLPLPSGKSSYLLDGKKLNCLPKLLSSAGYKSFFYKSYADDSFDNTKEFFTDIGFDYVMNPQKLGYNDDFLKQKSFSWGIRDDVSYEIFLNELEKKFGQSDAPFLATMTTLSHHVPFELPSSWRFLYPKKDGKKYNFLNSLHLSDKFLQLFLEKFNKSTFKENTIVVITGDHSFPNGRQGSFFNEKGASEDNFKVPMVIILPEELRHKFTKKRQITSHVDLIPSLLNLLGVKKQQYGHGVSMFSDSYEPTVLVQPYNGGAIKIISQNKKYIWFSSNKYFIAEGTLDNDSTPYNYVPYKNDIVQDSVESFFKKQNFLMDKFSID